MLNTVVDNLSNLETSDDGEDVDEENPDQKHPELGKLSEDDKTSCVMGTCSIVVQHGMECFRQKQMKLDELTQPGWGDAINYFCDRDEKYDTTEITVLAVIELQTEDDAV